MWGDPRVQRARLLQDRLHADRAAVVVVAPNAQGGGAHRPGQPVIEGHPVQWATHRDGGDRVTRVADRRCDTTESGDRFGSLIGDAAGPYRGQFFGQLTTGGDRVPGLAGQQVDVEVEVELVRIGERQQRLADRGAVRGLTATDAGGNRGAEPAGDLLQVDHVRPVEDGEVHHQTGGPVQLVQEWLRGAV